MGVSNRKSSWRQNLLGFLVLLLIIAFVVPVLWASLNFFAALSPQAAAGVVAVLGSTFTLVFTKQWEKQREIEQQQRDKKTLAYEEFVSFWYRLLAAQKLGTEGMAEEQMIEFFTEFNQKVLIWGSDDVLKRYSETRQVLATDNGTPNMAAFMLSLEDLLLAMRRDLGHRNKKLVRGDLLPLFLQQDAIDEVMKPQLQPTNKT